MAATLEELERRVIALEKTQNENTVTLKWQAGTLAQVKALADDHTERLQRIEQNLNGQSTRLDRLDQPANALRVYRLSSRKLKAILADIRVAPKTAARPVDREAAFGCLQAIV